MYYKIGIDSGGTHVVAQAFSKEGAILAAATAGPGNSLLNLSQTKENLEKVLTAIFATLPRQNCELIVAGVAGSQSAGNQDQLADFLFRSFGCPVRVISDSELARLKGLQGDDGLLVIAGTGSIVLGRFNNREYRVGGWGHLLGDQGSAYDLVRQTFKGMLQEVDTGQSGPLTSLILQVFAVPDPLAAVASFNRLSREEIASFGKKLVTQGENNTAFQAIVTHCGQSLGKQVLTLLSRVAPAAPTAKVAITGSVLTKNHTLQQAFKEVIQKKYPQVTFIPLVGTNATGVLYYKGVDKHDI